MTRSRQEMYRAALADSTKELRGLFYRVGEKGTVGGWAGTTRKQVRMVARMSARSMIRDMKQMERMRGSAAS